MKYTRLLVFIAIFLSQFVNSFSAFGQRITKKDKDRVFLEGMALYTLILGNWTSNDLYYENEFDTTHVYGYLSYRDKDTLKTIFWRRIDTASVEYKKQTYKKAGDTIATEQTNKEIELDRIMRMVEYPNMKVTKGNGVIPDAAERDPTSTEKMFINYRDKTYKEIDSDTSFFKKYIGTTLRAVPIDAGNEIRVYVYSSTKKKDVVPIGGDYLLVFDKKTGNLISKQDLHQECIFIPTHYNGNSYDAIKSTTHTHKPGTSPIITPTDIATLLLYKKMLEWDEHIVVGDKYTSVFTLVDRKLDVMPTKEYKAMKEKADTKEKEAKKYKMK